MTAPALHYPPVTVAGGRMAGALISDRPRILTVNTGSSSLKLTLYRVDGDSEVAELAATADRISTPGGRFRLANVRGEPAGWEQIDLPDHTVALAAVLERLRGEGHLRRLVAVGHRVVHGGGRYREPVPIAPGVVDYLRILKSIDPQHMSQAVSAVEALDSAFPAIPQIACFDTAFHAAMPRIATLYALPRALSEEGILRYGFHGLSYEYVVGELRRMDPVAGEGRVVIAHLGNGASMAAVRGGVGIDTTMGFTPTGGLAMGTRSGDLDPGVLVHLLRSRRMEVDVLDALVNEESGLLGLSGTTSDMRDLLAREGEDRCAAEAVDVFCYVAKSHGGPAVLANVYLEGTYSEIYPEVSRDAAGMRRLFRQFSTPGGVPSHVSVPTPGSIHEGGELGYVLAHAFGTAFDNPDLLVLAVVGDGEAETAPLEGSWKSTGFIDPSRDGAVLPVLHLNGYKISGPTVLARTPDEEVRLLLEGHGYEPRFVEGDDPARVHQAFASTLEACHDRIRAIQTDARENGFSRRPRWPAIVLRTPKGWTGPEEVNGLPVEGTFRSHQVPLADVREDPERLGRLRAWMLSYRPDELFDEGGRPVPGLGALVPEAAKRMGASPYANGGRLLEDLDLPDFRDYSVEVSSPARVRRESTRLLGEMLRDTFLRNAEAKNFRLFCPDETNSNRLGAVFEATDRCFVGETLPMDDHVAPSGRVMEVLSEHLCEGWLEGYLLTGRHGLFATYEAFAMVSSSMTVQHTKWLEEAVRLPWREPIASLNVLLTSTCWRNDHNGFSHQGPGLIDVMLSKRGTVARIYLPPDANCLLSVADHCFRSRDYVNLIVIDKQPQLQWLGMDEAIDHCARGASVWEWASNVPEGEEPDVVLACAGDIPTLETAAAHWLRRNAPGLSVRVVNVVDLMALFPREFHPHGMDETRFVELFTADKPVVFAFHGYQRAIHEIVHGHVDRFHVRGFNEQGTTTTPFEMTVLNGMSRYHLAAEALMRSAEYPNSRPQASAPTLISECEALISKASAYAREHLEDPPEIHEWRWSP